MEKPGLVARGCRVRLSGEIYKSVAPNLADDSIPKMFVRLRPRQTSVISSYFKPSRGKLSRVIKRSMDGSFNRGNAVPVSMELRFLRPSIVACTVVKG